MAEYIEREAIMEFPIRKDHCDKERANEHFIFGIESVLEYVENLPAADVAPVVHGRWMKRRNGGTLCSRCGHYTQYKGQVLDMSEAIACPWCGAMMDGEE